MEHLTFREHLILTEARRKDLKYTEKKVKDKLDRVQVALSGTESASMTKLAKRYARLEVSLKAMKEKHDELNGILKENVAELFDAEDVVLTRVVETAQFTLTMAKEIKKDDSTSVDYEKIVAALTALIPDELQERVDQIVRRYTSVVPAKAPIKKLSVSKEVNENLNEGILDSVERLKKWAAGLLKQVTSWAVRYDKKLEKLKAQAGV